MEGRGGSGTTKPTVAEKRAAEERIVYRRRRRVALSLLVILAGFLYYGYCMHYSGRLVLLQQASAADITRGFTFGPFYAPARSSCAYGYRVQLPASGPLWETRLEILDEHGLTIHPQTDFILAGAHSFGDSSSFARCSHFKLRDAGYYFLRFTQLDGTYSATLAASGSPPVMQLWVRTGVIRGWLLWLPLLVIALLLLSFWVFW